MNVLSLLQVSYILSQNEKITKIDCGKAKTYYDAIWSYDSEAFRTGLLEEIGDAE